MTVITGVSGSGKSTLVNDILYRSQQQLCGSREEPSQHGRVIGIDQLDKVIQIDQSAIAAPRSNPPLTPASSPPSAFSCLLESRERYYKLGFSFNVRAAAAACQGSQRRIEMNFLPTSASAKVCNGRAAIGNPLRQVQRLLHRRPRHTIADAARACPVNAKLQTLVDGGLGYIHLGQSATTLSGASRHVEARPRALQAPDRANSLPPRRTHHRPSLR
jgi:excinuclease ABC subunit A